MIFVRRRKTFEQYCTVQSWKFPAYYHHSELLRTNCYKTLMAIMVLHTAISLGFIGTMTEFLKDF